MTAGGGGSEKCCKAPYPRVKPLEVLFLHNFATCVLWITKLAYFNGKQKIVTAIKWDNENEDPRWGELAVGLLIQWKFHIWAPSLIPRYQYPTILTQPGFFCFDK